MDALTYAGYGVGRGSAYATPCSIVSHDSDADVAVVLRGHIDNRWSLRRLIIRDTYPILLETGLYIQAWPLEARELDDPDTSANPALLRNVLREGIAG